ncbi:ribosomal L29e protein family-domain-containing protein, partial [Aspergillus fruticulosus]
PNLIWVCLFLSRWITSPANSRQPSFSRDETVKMAKSKNASQHHRSQKAHRNGIKKPKTNRYPSLKGVDPKFRRNHRHALHGTAKALKERKEGKREIA